VGRPQWGRTHRGAGPTADRGVGTTVVRDPLWGRNHRDVGPTVVWDPPWGRTQAFLLSAKLSVFIAKSFACTGDAFTIGYISNLSSSFARSKAEEGGWGVQGSMLMVGEGVKGPRPRGGGGRMAKTILHFFSIN
jgi:hypothetical protein